MSASDFLSLIQPQLDVVERKITTELHSDNKIVEQMLQYTLTGKGKRLRPALVMLSGRATGGELTDTHLEVAVAIELIHTATLVHDDIIDEATLRRQKSSLNAKYGNEMAVIFGDYVLAIAFSMLAKLSDPSLLGSISQVTNTICEGELFQMHRRFDFNLSRGDYLKMIEQKTASLFAISCRLGAMLAGGSAKEQTKLEKFGHELGVAFQIVDDCLDILGDEERIGKSLGTDLKKGKWTLPLIRLREAMKKSDWEDVRVLLFEDLEELRMKKLVSYLMEHDAVERAVEEAQERVQKAKEHLQDLPETPAKKALLRLAEDVIERNGKIFKKVLPEKEAASA